jgi:hypothetical protein
VHVAQTEHHRLEAPRRTAALRPVHHGIAAGQVLRTRVGLILPPELSYDEWQQAGPKLVRIADSSAWCLGDWLLHGQRCYRNRYKRATEEAGLDYQTLRNYAWIARRFEHQRRRVGLSLQHHAEVASLSDDEQDRWLDLAEGDHWSRNEMRRRIREQAADNGDHRDEATYMPRLQVAGTELSLWHKAAENAHTDFEAWVVVALNRAAAPTSDQLSHQEN